MVTNYYSLPPFQGPNNDEEEVQTESITEMKEQKQKAIQELLLKQEQQRLEEEERIRAKEAEGVSWGMVEDAEDEPDLSVNPFAVNTNEELFLDDPKKTLRGFFEREGLELEYKAEDLPNQTFSCRVELPLDDENGRPIVAKVTHKGKKKDCVVQCALEACRILDRHGVLRRANQEAAAVRRRKNSESDNEDDFLDRTGDVEKKRKRKAQAQEESVRTYDELVEQEKEVQEKILELEAKIKQSKGVGAKKKGEEEEEMDLDDFMSQLKKTETPVDKVEVRKWRLEQQTLQKDLKRVQRLIEITRPLEMPKLQKAAEEMQEVVKEKEKNVAEDENVPLKKGKVEETEEPVRDDERSKETVKVAAVVAEISLKHDKPPNVVVNEKKADSSPMPPPPKKILVNSPPKNNKPNKIAQQLEDEVQAKKKARQRIRNRKPVRDNVDIEETEEETDKEKFSDWLPPSNQTGDGTTSLNEKLGY